MGVNCGLYDHDFDSFCRRQRSVVSCAATGPPRRSELLVEHWPKDVIEPLSGGRVVLAQLVASERL